MKTANVINEVPGEILGDFFSSTDRGLLLTLKIKPGAKVEKLQIAGIDELTLSVSARAVDNAANVRVCEVLASILGVKKTSVQIISGHLSRKKIILISGISLATLMANQP
jgi:uncharacterized protein YggU (UPF0235/DUF167 family)